MDETNEQVNTTEDDGVVKVMEWVDGEVVIRPATPEEIAEIESRVVINTTPQTVTRRQARQALLLRGLLDQIEPAIQALPDATQRGLALIEWQDSLSFERQRPLVIQIGQAIGLDSDGLDELFIFASTL